MADPDADASRLTMNVRFLQFLAETGQSGIDAMDGAPSSCGIIAGLELRRAMMGNVTTIGLDIAKSVFQVHGVDAAG
ncbi:hypothetical protein GCM10011499_35760 [Pelagibacterium lentulum]|uniref:Uncharacterized protein n=1 Tax=Pelagibacterium lentulum TaxID=2029865 RepID=A0A916RN06_9HYPH|nr:hypothetical protein GCM10011499_35760 [Pelagibacterium lentulum]